MNSEDKHSYKPDHELVEMARKAGFIMPDFAIDSPNDNWAGRKVSSMWLALAKFRHICQLEEKAKFADAYFQFSKK